MSKTHPTYYVTISDAHGVTHTHHHHNPSALSNIVVKVETNKDAVIDCETLGGYANANTGCRVTVPTECVTCIECLMIQRDTWPNAIPLPERYLV